MAFGVTDQGFVLKRLNDILTDFATALSTVQDPVSGETLTPNMADENDPLIQIVNASADALAAAWEQLQLCYNQFDPLKATGAGLSGLVQLNGLIRQSEEIDTTLRARQQVSTEATSRTSIEDLFASIRNLPTVTFCRVYQNTTLSTDARSIPAKSIAPVIVGGVDADIADVIFAHLGMGTDSYGSTTVTVYDAQGLGYSIGFTRPTEVPIYVDIHYTVINTALWPTNGETLIEEAIIAYAAGGAGALGIDSGFDQAGLTPGTSVYAAELYVPVNSVPGMQITALTVAKTPTPTAASVIIAWNEVATFTAANITFTAA